MIDKYISCPTRLKSVDPDKPPFGFMSLLVMTTMLFAAYEAFFDQSSAQKGLEVLGLMAVVATLEALQVLAINVLEDKGFLGALVAKNILGQLTELVIYEDIKAGALYDNYPMTTMALNSIGMGALKVCGQVAGKSIRTNSSRESPVSHGLNIGASGVMTLLWLTEAVRENSQASDYLKNTLLLGTLGIALFAVSAAQSIAVKKLSHAHYPYFGAVLQMTSVGISFALSNQFQVGDPWFSGNNANLVCRSITIASVKMEGYLAGRFWIMSEKEKLAHNGSELIPLLGDIEDKV